VKVLYGEGLTPHTGPESCVSDREVRGEALTGDCIGQPLSRERILPRGADAVVPAEGETAQALCVSGRPSGRGRRPWHVQTLLVREPGDLGSVRDAMSVAVRVGKARSRSRR